MPTPALGFPAFPDLQEDALQTLFAHTAVKTLPKNTVIINEGDRTNSVYLIRSGRVKVFLRNEDGERVDINGIVVNPVPQNGFTHLAKPAPFAFLRNQHSVNHEI